MTAFFFFRLTMNFLKGTAALLIICLEIFCVNAEKLPSDISERKYTKKNRAETLTQCLTA